MDSITDLTLASYKSLSRSLERLSEMKLPAASSGVSKGIGPVLIPSP